MQSSIINFGVKQYLTYRYRRTKQMHADAPLMQRQVLQRLLSRLQKTAYGKYYGPVTYSSFSEAMPVVTYEDLYPWIHRAIVGEKDVLYPGTTRYFAKSSGTTNDRSKYIPVSDEMISDNFIGSSWDAMSMVYQQIPDARIFADKSLLIGGTLHPHPANPLVTAGDVSAIMINEMPGIGRPFYTPDFDTAMLDDFELKLKRMVDITADEPVTMFGGVPTWLIVLMKQMLHATGKEHMGQVWPQARLYMHGGVGFAPYRDTFDQLFPQDQLAYMNIYNASEGYIGLQDDFSDDSLLLMVDNGIYYEFLTLSDYEAGQLDRVIPLKGVNTNDTYVLIMSSVSGLWRYMAGDTVRFTSTSPYRLQVAGRTTQYINAFGEEVVISNTDQAVAEACLETRSRLANYTVAPIYLDGDKKGGHQWLVEWDSPPHDIAYFTRVLDQKLRAINSDYDAKRSSNLALEELQVKVLPHGTFDHWLKIKGKSGAQIKIPRLKNDRSIVTELLLLCD